MFEIRVQLLYISLYFILFQTPESFSVTIDRKEISSIPFDECILPTVAELENGNLLAAWIGRKQKAKQEQNRIWFSRYEHNSWHFCGPFKSGKNATTNYKSPVLFYNNHILYLFYQARKNRKGDYSAYVTISTNYGNIWGADLPLPATFYGPSRNKPLLLQQKKLLFPTRPRGERNKVTIEVFNDFEDQITSNALTKWGELTKKYWRVIDIISTGKQRLESTNPTIIKLDESNFRIFCRSIKGNRISTALSTNKGETWSELSESQLPCCDADIDAVTLNDGRHLIVYNHSTDRNRGRRAIHFALSKDGENWQPPVVLEESEKRQEFTHPAVIQASDGMVHILYTSNYTNIHHSSFHPDESEATAGTIKANPEGSEKVQSKESDVERAAAASPPNKKLKLK